MSSNGLIPSLSNQSGRHFLVNFHPQFLPGVRGRDDLWLLCRSGVAGEWPSIWVEPFSLQSNQNPVTTRQHHKNKNAGRQRVIFRHDQKDLQKRGSMRRHFRLPGHQLQGIFLLKLINSLWHFIKESHPLWWLFHSSMLQFSVITQEWRTSQAVVTTSENVPSWCVALLFGLFSWWDGRELNGVECIAGGWTGLLSCLLNSPVELIKTRLQMQRDEPIKRYKNDWDCLKKIYKAEGVKVLSLLPTSDPRLRGLTGQGVYRGMLSCILRDVPSYIGKFETSQSALINSVFEKQLSSLLTKLWRITSTGRDTWPLGSTMWTRENSWWVGRWLGWWLGEWATRW